MGEGIDGCVDVQTKGRDYKGQGCGDWGKFIVKSGKVTLGKELRRLRVCGKGDWLAGGERRVTDSVARGLHPSVVCTRESCCLLYGVASSLRYLCITILIIIRQLTDHSFASRSFPRRSSRNAGNCSTTAGHCYSHFIDKPLFCPLRLVPVWTLCLFSVLCSCFLFMRV